jgi:hypothetical protein
MQGHRDDERIIRDAESGIIIVSHQAAEPFAEGEVPAVFKSLNGVEKNRLINAKRPGGTDMPLVQDAFTAGVIRALFGGVGDAADRAEG